MIKIPSFFKPYAVDVTEDDYVRFQIQSTIGNNMFDIYYYGDLMDDSVEAEPFITRGEFAPSLIVAEDIYLGERIVLFDGTRMGYDSMFCDECTEEQKKNRPLKKLEIPTSKVRVTLGYGIDYEEEKEDYEFNADGNTILIDQSSLPWNDVITDGFDYLCISVIQPDGSIRDICDEELA